MGHNGGSDWGDPCIVWAKKAGECLRRVSAVRFFALLLWIDDVHILTEGLRKHVDDCWLITLTITIL